MNIQQQKGFFLVEVIVAVSVIATVLLFLLSGIQDSVEASQRSLERMQASYLLEEGAEALRGLRSSGWSAISSLQSNTTYYLSWSGSSWSITTTPQTVDSFTRTITAESVYRDGNGDIAGSGTIDTGTKKITVTVTWNAPSSVKTESLSFYLFDI